MTRFNLRTTILALTISLLSAAPLFAEYDSMWDDDDYRSLRLDFPYDLEGNIDGDGELGFQIGFGVGSDKVDEFGILMGHADADYGNRTHFALWMEENYPNMGSVIPYAGVNLGWAKFRGDEVDDSIYGKVEIGGKFFVCPTCAITGSLGVSLSLDNIFITEDGLDDKNFEFGVGLRWYY